MFPKEKQIKCFVILPKSYNKPHKIICLVLAGTRTKHSPGACGPKVSFYNKLLSNIDLSGHLRVSVTVRHWYALCPQSSFLQASCEIPPMCQGFLKHVTCLLHWKQIKQMAVYRLTCFHHF